MRLPTGSYSSMGGDGFPFLQNGTIQEGIVAAQAKFDHVIMDLGSVDAHPEVKDALRAANQDLKLHAYVVLKAWDNPNGPRFYKDVWNAVKTTNGFLTCTNGQWWSFMNINVANRACMEWLADLILAASSEWDGIFIDLLIPQLWSAAQYGGETLDWAGMGFRSEQEFLQAWKDNALMFVQRLNRSEKPVTTNYGIGFPHVTDGNMYEEFDRDFNRWVVSVKEGELHLGFPAAWLCSAPFTNDPDYAANKRIMRFGRATAALFGGIFSFGRYEGNKAWCTQRAKFLYPDYNVELGEPEGPAVSNSVGLWYRLYTRGIAIVNPTNTAQSIYLPQRYQPPGAAAKNAFSIPPRDGMIAREV